MLSRQNQHLQLLPLSSGSPHRSRAKQPCRRSPSSVDDLSSDRSCRCDWKGGLQKLQGLLAAATVEHPIAAECLCACRGPIGCGFGARRQAGAASVVWVLGF